uniref:Cyclin C-terminal domain-containing protein n=1 Tax=Glossina brevipalpis TaxID=37001 RepID=A0A1A9WCR6_9MUSC
MNIEQNSFSPAIPLIRFQQVPIANVFTDVSATSTFDGDSRERINKSYWVSDYSEDIFETLLQTEMKRREIRFRSQQYHFRPMLLKLIKDACDCHKLCRLTLHLGKGRKRVSFKEILMNFILFNYVLAVHLLDCFMDKFTIRVDRLNLTVLACLMIAAKIEEADIDMPKFAQLNELVSQMYTLNDFKRVECKVLTTFNFDLIRPTAATFSEYFSKSFLTLNDYQRFLNLWQSQKAINQYRLLQEQQLQSGFLPCKIISGPIIKMNCPYSSYDDMLTTLSKKYFELVDASLNCLKFANIKSSIVASACIAAVRKMHGISPIWTTELEDLTKYGSDTISPFVDALLAVYRLQFEEEHSLIPYSFAAASTSFTSTSKLCDSPDSGVALANDLKSDTDNEHDYESDGDDSYGEADNEGVEGEHNEGDKGKERNEDDEEEEPYYCLEYPLMSKRRRLL